MSHWSFSAMDTLPSDYDYRTTVRMRRTPCASLRPRNKITEDASSHNALHLYKNIFSSTVPKQSLERRSALYDSPVYMLQWCCSPGVEL